jgi:hypothetical protein
VLDPASLRKRQRRCRARLGQLAERVTDQAAQENLGKDSIWLAPSAWVAVRDAVKHDPSVLQKVATLNLPASAELDLAAKSDGSDEAEAAYARLDRSDAGRHLGRVQGFAADYVLVTLLLSFPIGVLGGALS